MRPKFAKDDLGIYQSTGLDVFVRVSQGAMQRSAIFLGQPITGIEGQELDLGSFGQIGRLVNDKPASLHASLQRHATTLASGPPRNKVPELARGRGRAPIATQTLPERKKSRNR